MRRMVKLEIPHVYERERYGKQERRVDKRLD